MQVSFEVPHEPIPQPRQRSRIVRSAKAYIQNYTPAKHPVASYKRACVEAARDAMKRMSPLVGPLSVELVFVMPRPSNKIWKTKPMPAYYRDAKPDIDNLEKSTFDALNGVLWQDDSQVCVVNKRKVVAAGDESPRVKVAVRTIEEVVV